MAIAKIKTPANGSANGSPDIGIDNRARKEVAQCLTYLLADTYVLQLKTQYYHWNVTGENFQALHTLFGAQYDALALSVDELAERVRALGHIAPGTFREFLALSLIEEDKSLPSGWKSMVHNLVAARETITRNTRKWLETVQKAGDEGTADIFIKMLQEHEKAAWMLRSHL